MHHHLVSLKAVGVFGHHGQGVPRFKIGNWGERGRRVGGGGGGRDLSSLLSINVYQNKGKTCKGVKEQERGDAKKGLSGLSCF